MENNTKNGDHIAYLELYHVRILKFINKKKFQINMIMIKKNISNQSILEPNESLKQ